MLQEPYFFVSLASFFWLPMFELLRALFNAGFKKHLLLLSSNYRRLVFRSYRKMAQVRFPILHTPPRTNRRDIARF